MYLLPNRANAPFQNDYRHEIDVSDELSPEFASYYQLSIGIWRWMVELGHVDITAEVSIMSWCLALLHEGHLKALFHMSRYLKKKHNSVRTASIMPISEVKLVKHGIYQRERGVY